MLSNVRAEMSLTMLACRSGSFTAQYQGSDQGAGGAENDRSPGVISAPLFSPQFGYVEIGVLLDLRALDPLKIAPSVSF